MCWPSYLPGQLGEEVLIRSKGPQAVKVADGGGQWLQFITATVQLLQKRQTRWKEKKQRRDEGKMFQKGRRSKGFVTHGFKIWVMLLYFSILPNNPIKGLIKHDIIVHWRQAN